MVKATNSLTHTKWMWK